MFTEDIHIGPFEYNLTQHAFKLRMTASPVSTYQIYATNSRFRLCDQQEFPNSALRHLSTFLFPFILFFDTLKHFVS